MHAGFLLQADADARCAPAQTVKLGGDGGELGFFPNSVTIAKGESVTWCAPPSPRSCQKWGPVPCAPPRPAAPGLTRSTCQSMPTHSYL